MKQHGVEGAAVVFVEAISFGLIGTTPATSAFALIQGVENPLIRIYSGLIIDYTSLSK